MTTPRSSTAHRDTTVQSPRPYVCSGVALVGVGAPLATLGGITSQPRAVADPLPYGPDTCARGYVWLREANPNNHICVTPDERSRTP
jgi:hypothetical protein